MSPQQWILFATVTVVYLLTALVTIGGVIGVFHVDTAILRGLTTAVLAESAAAIYALFKKVLFVPEKAIVPDKSVAMSIGAGFESLDRISDEIRNALQGTTSNHDDHLHQFLIARVGNNIGAYQRMKIVTGETLEKLPADQKRVIRTYETAMERLEDEWHKAKRTGGDKKRELQLLKDMRGEIIGLLDFLEAQGIYLDDHYQIIRSLISRLP